jgi:hypothetical protein
MYVTGMDGNATIRWDTCDPAKFRHDPIFMEAMYCGRIKNLQDLAVFLDDSSVLDYIDAPVAEAILEINRNLFNCVDVPTVYYWVEKEYCLMFSPAEDDVYIGTLDENDAWTYVSIKSML